MSNEAGPCEIAAFSETNTPPTPVPRRRFRERFLDYAFKRFGELSTVFVGVYAAFLLNNYETHRHDQQRREQILAWMDAEFTEALASVRREKASGAKVAEEFNRKVENGEMPVLRALDFRSDYDPSDMASLLQVGGFDLLEIQTVRAMRDVEATQRLMIVAIRHDQQLSDALILPNLDKDPGVFYDPVTHKLRPAYRWYTNFYASTLDGFSTLQSQLETLLRQIKRERERNR